MYDAFSNVSHEADSGWAQGTVDQVYNASAYIYAAVNPEGRGTLFSAPCPQARERTKNPTHAHVLVRIY